MSTANDLVEATRRHLFSGQNEELNRLAGAVTNVATTMTMTYDLGGIQKGMIIAIDLEEIQVWETSGKIITVCSRGVNGSTAASHADLATVTVKPKFSQFRILSAINTDLSDLSAPDNGLFRIKNVTLTFSPVIQGYDMTSVTSDLLGVLDVRYSMVGPEKSWPRVEKWSLLRNMSTAEFTSGTALVLYDGGFPGRSVRVTYKAPYSSFTQLSDDVVSVSGLQASAADIPPLGAAMRLVAPRDVKRAFSEHQGEPRRADEVPVGSATSSMRGLMMLRGARITSERSRLVAQYPNTQVW